MKVNVYFTLIGPGGEQEIPNSQNPIEVEDWTNCLRQLALWMREPQFFGLHCTGIRLEEVGEL